MEHTAVDSTCLFYLYKGFGCLEPATLWGLTIALMAHEQRNADADLQELPQDRPFDNPNISFQSRLSQVRQQIRFPQIALPARRTVSLDIREPDHTWRWFVGPNRICRLPSEKCSDAYYVRLDAGPTSCFGAPSIPQLQPITRPSITSTDSTESARLGQRYPGKPPRAQTLSSIIVSLLSSHPRPIITRVSLCVHVC
jgi:hypothetical protein